MTYDTQDLSSPLCPLEQKHGVLTTKLLGKSVLTGCLISGDPFLVSSNILSFIPIPSRYLARARHSEITDLVSAYENLPQLCRESIIANRCYKQRSKQRVPGAENKHSPRMRMPLEETELHGLTLTLSVAVADQGCAFQRLLSMGQSE